MSEYFQSERRTVRGIALLEGEEPLLTLHSRNGLLPGPPPEEDDFLLLTNRRMMGRVSEGERERYVISRVSSFSSRRVVLPLFHAWAVMEQDKTLAAHCLYLSERAPRLEENELTREWRRSWTFLTGTSPSAPSASRG